LKKVFFYTILHILLLGFLCSSCASYRQNIMFTTEGGAALEQHTREAEKNYVIQKNDYLTLQVFTNDGERIIDPDYKLLEDMPSQNVSTRPSLRFLVNDEGVVKFPMLGPIKVEGLLLRDAEALLQKEYARFYEKPFVALQYDNKRVVVLGAPGGQVIPLANENIKLVEVLALAKGLPNDSKAKNIRVLRGDKVFVADLSTVDGYIKSNMVMENGDVVYVEPVRRPFAEGVRDYGPALSILTSISTLVIVLIGL